MDTTLVVLAAGLGSRFGGGSAKQVARLGKHGEILADFSAFDAIRAGFTKIVFVIKDDMKDAFVENVASRIKGAAVELAFQRTHDLPPGFAPPPDRQKPWGTAHALWAARHNVKEPFMMIHADDFYGAEVYKLAHDFLTGDASGDFDYAMGGYRLENTLSDHGGVSRGVCAVSGGFLTDIVETLQIQRRPDGIAYPDGDGFKYLPGSTIVSMGAFALKPTVFNEIEKSFAEFLAKNGQNPKAELFATTFVSGLISGGIATVKILETKDQWLGVTYPEDKERVQAALWDLIARGEYPEKLF
ncbi:MAG: nucleotidyltransferase [Clostridiales bacterium]|jgi:NDP-sugar pyrophosphorylase family protein|nr:nucleotidyltransferase [Clostridiales bacterium]